MKSEMKESYDAKKEESEKAKQDRTEQKYVDAVRKYVCHRRATSVIWERGEREEGITQSHNYGLRSRMDCPS